MCQMVREWRAAGTKSFVIKCWYVKYARMINSSQKIAISPEVRIYCMRTARENPIKLMFPPRSATLFIICSFGQSKPWHTTSHITVQYLPEVSYFLYGPVLSQTGNVEPILCTKYYSLLVNYRRAEQRLQQTQLRGEHQCINIYPFGVIDFCSWFF